MAFAGLPTPGAHVPGAGHLLAWPQAGTAMDARRRQTASATERGPRDRTQHHGRRQAAGAAREPGLRAHEADDGGRAESTDASALFQNLEIHFFPKEVFWFLLYSMLIRNKAPNLNSRNKAVTSC